ncbi:MAG: hypothetical protein M5U26_11210 [Planctomycetota bacterium]|nr:hypothetical protein [Planctomycetota bacterium]
MSFFLVLRWALQRRARRQIDAGLPQPSWPGVPESLTFAAIAAALALVVAGACSIWFDFEAAWDSFLPVLLLSVSGAAALLACWYAYRLRLWEYALAASGVAAALAILSLYGEPAAMWGVCSFGLAFFVSGLFLRRRWRHWMSAHPAKGERA